MDDDSYSGAAFLGGVILTIWLPPVALIAALVLLRQHPGPRKRSVLRAWAWTSTALIVFGLVFVLLAVA